LKRNNQKNRYTNEVLKREKIRKNWLLETA
jgi:hypothetical protein